MHPTKCDVINDVSLFSTVYQRIYCRKFWTSNRVTKSSALEFCLTWDVSSIYEPAHEILVLIVLLINEGSGKYPCLHTQNMDIDEDSYQMIYIKLCYMCQHGCYLETLEYAISPKFSPACPYTLLTLYTIVTPFDAFEIQRI